MFLCSSCILAYENSGLTWALAEILRAMTHSRPTNATERRIDRKKGFAASLIIVIIFFELRGT